VDRKRADRVDAAERAQAADGWPVDAAAGDLLERVVEPVAAVDERVDDGEEGVNGSSPLEGLPRKPC